MLLPGGEIMKENRNPCAALHSSVEEEQWERMLRSYDAKSSAADAAAREGISLRTAAGLYMEFAIAEAVYALHRSYH